ncbi:MAG: hypothetical protein R3B91_23895 [Planctomycetaceae bacterium]
MASRRQPGRHGVRRDPMIAQIHFDVPLFARLTEHIPSALGTASVGQQY